MFKQIGCLGFIVFLSFIVNANSVFKQHFEGAEFPVNYEKYGKFEELGTKDYQYNLNDYDGLAMAVGDGIFPNNYTIFEDPSYKQLIKERRLVGERWNFINGADIHACYFKWALVEDEEPGVKLFYTAYNLERAGLIKQAVKAYYACAIHFPRSVGWTYWGTPWYVGLKSIEIVEALLRENPEIGYTLVDADIFVENGFDADAGNDIFHINPGKIVKTDSLPPSTKDNKTVIREFGGKKAKVVQYKSGDWAFELNGKPTLLKSISYQPAPVMQSYDEGTMSDWMQYDSDKNGLLDAPLESFADKNGNNVQDADEPSEGDFSLMQKMGVNAIRIYHHATDKEILRKGYKDYGINVIQGDLLGMYCIGSGASWDKGTDYKDPIQKSNMLKSVEKMVREFKDEPYVIMWVLGNENNYGGVFGHIGGAGNAAIYPKEFYSFVNEAAKLVKSIDPSRPVAICNGDTGFIDVFSKYCPDIDVFGANAYRGKHGFGTSIWGVAKKLINRPVLIMEYGCPAYHRGKNLKIGADEQAEYNVGCWNDIVFNSYLGNGAGTAIGGVLFQWVDGWWKSGQPPRFSPAIQETVGQWPGPFPDGMSYEEWYGVCGHGNGAKSPFIRVLRKTYYAYQELWNE